MSPDVEIRTATHDDIRAFYRQDLPHTAYAWIALYKGEPACIAGVTLARTGAVAFSDIKPGLDAPKFTIWRTARELAARIKAMGLPMIAAADPCRETSRKFIESLGFTFHACHDGKDILAWKP